MTPVLPTDRVTVRIRRTSVEWLVAWAVVLHALLARFLPEAGVLAWVAVLATVGAAFRTSPVRLRGRRAALGEALLGAISLAVLGLVLAGLATLFQGDGTARRPLWLPPWIALLVLGLAEPAVWRRLGRLVGVEWLKTRRSLIFKAGLLGTAAITLLAAVAHEKLPGETGWTVACASLGTGQWCAEVFLLVLGAVALAGEATGGTLKMMLPHAYRRSDWILAKALVLLGVAVCFAAVVAAVSVGHALLTEGLGDVTRELEPMFGEETGTIETFQTADVMRGHFADILLAGLAALAATALLALFLSSLFDGVVPALCVAFLLFAGLKFADVLFALPRETFQGIYTWAPSELRNLTGKLGRALNERWDTALFPEGLRLALLMGSAALLAAIGVFSRRDLQA